MGERRVALAVGAVIGVRTLPARSLEDLPPLLGGGRARVVEAIAALDSELLLVLQSARLIPETVWNVIEAEGVHA